MKKRILAYAFSAFAALSCSSMASLQTQVYDDGVYSRPSTAVAQANAADAEVDNLLAVSKQSPAYILNEGDTLAVPAGTKLRFSNNATVLSSVDTRPAWDLDYYWYYRPWADWDYAWYFRPWHYNPWYIGSWYLGDPLYRYYRFGYYHGYYSPWYYSSWYYTCNQKSKGFLSCSRFSGNQKSMHKPVLCDLPPDRLNFFSLKQIIIKRNHFHPDLYFQKLINSQDKDRCSSDCHLNRIGRIFTVGYSTGHG